jgi:hypothetical protein
MARNTARVLKTTCEILFDRSLLSHSPALLRIRRKWGMVYWNHEYGQCASRQRTKNTYWTRSGLLFSVNNWLRKIKSRRDDIQVVTGLNFLIKSRRDETGVYVNAIGTQTTTAKKLCSCNHLFSDQFGSNFRKARESSNVTCFSSVNRAWPAWELCARNLHNTVGRNFERTEAYIGMGTSPNRKDFHACQCREVHV